MIKFTKVKFIASQSRTFHFHNGMESVDGSCLNHLSLRWGLHVHHQCSSSFFTIFRLHCLWRITYISIKGELQFLDQYFHLYFLYVWPVIYLSHAIANADLNIFSKGRMYTMCRHVQKVFGHNGSVVNADELTV